MRAARLRDGDEGLAHLQPARCARRDLGHRARGLHRPRARARARRRPGLLRVARAARLPDEGSCAEAACWSSCSPRSCRRRRCRRSASPSPTAFATSWSRSAWRRRPASSTVTFATPRRLAVLVERGGRARRERRAGGDRAVGQRARRRRWPASRRSTAWRSRRCSASAGAKGEVFVARVKAGGAALDEVLAGVVDRVVRRLPIPR